MIDKTVENIYYNNSQAITSVRVFQNCYTIGTNNCYIDIFLQQDKKSNKIVRHIETLRQKYKRLTIYCIRNYKKSATSHCSLKEHPPNYVDE